MGGNNSTINYKKVDDHSDIELFDNIIKLSTKLLNEYKTNFLSDDMCDNIELAFNKIGTIKLDNNIKKEYNIILKKKLSNDTKYIVNELKVNQFFIVFIK